MTATQELAVERKAKRDELRRGVAQRELLTADWQRCNEVEIEIDHRKEELASRHVAACAPLQAELAAVEDEIVKNIQDRKPHDERLESRRCELLAEVARLGSELEDGIAALDRKLARNWSERRALGLELAELPDDAALVDTASPALKLELRVASAAERQAAQRVDALREKLEQFPSEREYLSALLRDAEKSLETARQRAAAAREACISEE